MYGWLACYSLPVVGTPTRDTLLLLLSVAVVVVVVEI